MAIATSLREEGDDTYNNHNSSSWSCAANWKVSHGSLDTSVTVESSDSPIDDSEAVNSTAKFPLVLEPHSPDSGPCEINITFNQKHEIRQVYVRSSARVYEIYYAPDLQSTNEYLCTVRCSIAAREEELLHPTDIQEAVLVNPKGSSGELDEGKFARDCSVSTSEDDWVEVKVPDSALLNKRNIPSLQKTIVSGSSEDYFEATAEITDADPCMSLTIRLLSLQNKGCVHVDEVYVFADSQGSDDSENEAVQVGNSAGSSLVAMLMPLMQLSKPGNGQLDGNRGSITMEKREYVEVGPKTSDSISISNKIQPDVRLHANNQDVRLHANNQDVKLHADHQNVKSQELRPSAEPVQVQVPTETSGRVGGYDSVAKSDLAYSQVGRVLEELVSRVSRIEDLCLRFEENMLKPINSMEVRLQRVEHQVEVLAKNSQSSELPSCTRFSAPAFSSLESNSSSFYNDGSDYPPCGVTELEKEDISSDMMSKSPNGSSRPLNAPQFVPSLVVTAPEFSCGDDEEENNVVESLKNSPPEKPNQTLLIDDALKNSPEKPNQTLLIDEALAAALTGFSFMVGAQPSEHIETSTATAFEVSSKENGSDEIHNYAETFIITAPESRSEEIGNGELLKHTDTFKLTAPKFRSEDSDNDDKVSSPCIQNDVLGHKDDELCEGYSGCGWGDLGTDGYEIEEEMNAQGTTKGTTNTSFSAKTEMLEQLLGSQSSSDSSEECARFVRDLFTDITQSSDASTVDFDIPILDVEFTSSQNSSAKSPLDALLTDVMTVDGETSLVRESDEQSNLSTNEDDETIITLFNNRRLVDLDGSDVVEVHSNMPGEELRDNLTWINQEMLTSLI